MAMQRPTSRRSSISSRSLSGDHDDDAFDRGLLELRNTPRPDGRSPAQVLYGRPLRSAVPAHRRAFAAEWQSAADVCDAKQEALMGESAAYYNSSAQPLPPIGIGTQVRLQDRATNRWSMVGTVVGIGNHRDYRVKLPSGRVFWRNRRFVRPLPGNQEQQRRIPSGPGVSASEDTTLDVPLQKKVRFTTPPRRGTRMRKRQDRLVF